MKKLFIKQISLTILSIAFLFGCAQKQTKTSDAMGPQPEITPEQQEEQAEDQRPSPKVTLVLGGVGISSFATVGLLKAFKEEGIDVASIITTGWPTVFVVGYGFSKSIHDLEWFSMRLHNKDFYNESFLGKKGFSNHDSIAKKLKEKFTHSSLGQSKTPISITASNLDSLKPDVYSSGNWVSPLLKAISAPGIHQPFPNRSSSQWVLSLDGLDTGIAQERGDAVIVAVDMYDDYLSSLRKDPDSSEDVFRALFLASFRSRLDQQFALAPLNARIQLRKNPLDFGAKRQAIQAGYEQGKRLAGEIRSRYSE